MLWSMPEAAMTPLGRAADKPPARLEPTGSDHRVYAGQSRLRFRGWPEGSGGPGAPLHPVALCPARISAAVHGHLCAVPPKATGREHSAHVGGSKARLSVTHAPPTQHLPECPSATKTSYHQLSGSEPHKFTVLEFHSQTPREAPRGEAKLSQATSP